METTYHITLTVSDDKSKNSISCTADGKTIKVHNEEKLHGTIKSVIDWGTISE
jgi:hypothetical protein